MMDRNVARHGRARAPRRHRRPPRSSDGRPRAVRCAIAAYASSGAATSGSTTPTRRRMRRGDSCSRSCAMRRCTSSRARLRLGRPGQRPPAGDPAFDRRVRGEEPGPRREHRARHPAVRRNRSRRMPTGLGLRAPGRHSRARRPARRPGRLAAPRTASSRYVVQVSRWDRLKDPAGRARGLRARDRAAHGRPSRAGRPRRGGRERRPGGARGARGGRRQAGPPCRPTFATACTWCPCRWTIRPRTPRW